jgi:hypothetical protein
MGAWGPGYFEDDEALDFMADVEEASHPKQVLTTAFDAAINASYLDPNAGTAVIVAATYVDRQLNGTRFSSPERDEPLAVDTFPDRQPKQDFSALTRKAVQALKKVVGDHSALNELWAETGEDYARWRLGVEQLIQRLDR